MLVIVNPAPIKKVDESVYKYIDYLVPNEHELEALSGEKDVIKGARNLLVKGVKNVIVTLGSKGSILVNNNEIIEVAPHKVHAIDTTAAGDSYLGALVNKLSLGADIKTAMEFASKCSSITVTRKGAIIALPHKGDIK
jgi:ribokinase